MLHNNHKTNFVFAIFISLFFYVFNLNEACTTNLDCPSTSCCKNKKCVENTACKQDMINVYLAVGLVGAAFFIISLIYFFASVKEIRDNVHKIKNASKDAVQISHKEDLKGGIENNNIQQLERKNIQSSSNQVNQYQSHQLQNSQRNIL
jgi:hypothetical protein